MVVSSLVVFLYGSIMWGIFPLKAEISWEGHLFGALAGVLVAFNYRKEGPKPRVYEWPEEDDDDETSDEENAEMPPEKNPENDLRINFIYKEKGK